MAKKMAMMRKVLYCFVVIAILMSVMSTSVLGVNANITSVSGMDKSTFGSNETVYSMHGKMEIKFIGTTVERCGIVAGADYWVVTVDELISGPSWSGQLTVYTIDIFADSPTWGYADPDITVRDKVEVYGKCVVRFADVYYVTLNGREDYYIKKKLDTPSKPDLTITRIWFNKNPCNLGDDIEIIFDVTNQGTGVANSCEDCLYIDGSKVAEFDSSGLAIGGELKPGETRTWYYLYEYVPGNPDPHKIRACADCLNSVTESEESDNCKIDDLDVESGREEIKFTGTSIEYFSRMGASGWTVRADEIISGPLELQGHTVTAYLASVNPDEYPYGYIDPNIEAGDKVEVYGWYQGGDNVALFGSKDYYIKRGGGCGKILEYAITNGTYTLPQTVMAHMKYKNYMKSPTKFKGVFLVKNQRTDKIYSCSKEQITNIDDRFGYGKGNSLQIRFEDEVEDIGVYDAKLELRNFYTDELCDETEWLEDQFKIDDGSAPLTCITFDELSQGDITGQTLHYEQVDFVAESTDGDVMVYHHAHSAPNGISLWGGHVTASFKTPVSKVRIWVASYAGGTKITLYASDGELLEDVSATIGDFSYYEFSYAKKISTVDIFSNEGAFDDFCFEVEGEPELRVHNLDTGKDFAKIQAAIDDTDTEDGHTIAVDAGTYNEYVVIDKIINLTGADRNNTIIDGMGGFKTLDILDAAGGCNVSNFCIRNATDGIFANGLIISADNCIVKDCIFTKNSGGIWVQHSMGTLIANNVIVNNLERGIYLETVSTGTIRNNMIKFNDNGIWGYRISNFSIFENNILDNVNYSIWTYDMACSNIYLNNFINNTENAYSKDLTNIWNSPSKIAYAYNRGTYNKYLGNYWDEYSGTDANGDGIGDIHYKFIDSEKDAYPLMEPFENYSLPTSAPT